MNDSALNQDIDTCVPSADEVLGMAWWNALTTQQRAIWAHRAGNTGVAADAWAAFKAAAPQTTSKDTP